MYISDFDRTAHSNAIALCIVYNTIEKKVRMGVNTYHETCMKW